ncbi:MAG: formylglycine-generating enzyme family protein [Myxococcota bacterium]
MAEIEAEPAKSEPAQVPEPEPEPAPEPEPEPEPEPVVAPDGTVIEPCGPVPEGMACIPGGPFIRGSDDGPKNARPAETVWMQTYYMDLHEVTYGDYKACQKTKECLRGGPLYNDFGRAKQPIVGPSWYAAVRYCEVKGKHLPTEAQWEKAARGPDGARYPWGDETATCDLAVIKDERGRSCGVKKKKEHPNKGRTFVVGTRAPGAYGLYDMAGNAWEWVYDWESKNYDACGKACRGTDPKGPCEGRDKCRGHEKRVVKGGSWYWDASYATGYYRRTHYPINEMQDFHHFGFRCAASLDEGKALATAVTGSEAEATEPEAPRKPEPTPKI